MMPVDAQRQEEIGLPRDARREQSERELARVEGAINDWFKLRRTRDRDEIGKYAGLHQTRLVTLQTVLQHGLDTLKLELGKVDVAECRDRRQVYRECGDVDRALIWMERVWAYYREKFDQRDDSSLGAILMAADEVIWSCYSQVFINKNYLPTGVTQGPAPLAYIDAEFSPATWEANKPSPAELRRSSDIEGLEQFLMTLPVPLLRLPPWCIAAPWWLVLVAHEVGHNIQRELDLVESFGSSLAKACRDHGLPQLPDAENWKRWGSEIFADLFSVAMMGEPALRSLWEVELANTQSLTSPRTSYPSPVVRLALLTAAADRMRLTASKALGDRPSLASQLTKADKDMVTLILDASLGPLSDGQTTLENVCGVQASRDDLDNRANYWGEQLLKGPPPPTRSRQAPRYITSGAWIAWTKAMQLASRADRQSKADVLSENTTAAIRTSGLEGARGATVRTPDLRRYGVDLADRLLELSREPVNKGDA